MIGICTPSFEIRKMLDMFFLDSLVCLAIELVCFALHVMAVVPCVESSMNLSIIKQPDPHQMKEICLPQ